jgi:membrane-anchored protein YejM (alkaline phosphatase superfamily)
VIAFGVSLIIVLGCIMLMASVLLMAPIVSLIIVVDCEVYNCFGLHYVDG